MTLALIIMLVWAAYGVFGPVTLKGGHAHHNALAVWMPQEAHSGNHLPSVKVQEVGEWKLVKITGLLCGLPGLLLIQDPIAQAFLTAIPMFAGDALLRNVPALDLAGHGAEIIAAEREGIIGYRAAEIDRMRRFDNRQNMTAEQVSAALDRWHWLARIVYWLGRG